MHCSDLNEIIRCASLDTVWMTDGTLKEKVLNRSIYQLRYQVIRSKTVSETLSSEANKKVYHSEVIHHLGSPKLALQQSQSILTQLKTCLDSWELDSAIQQPAGSQKLKDYLFTNSEDETTVRLSVERKQPKNYTVALEIY